LGRKVLINLLITLILFSTFTFAKDNKRVLLIYDTRSLFGYENDEVVSFKLLFGHFNVKVDEVSEKEYKKDSLKNYEYVFLMGLDDNKLSKVVEEDLINFKGTTVFIGSGFEDILKLNKFGGNVYRGKTHDAINVSYGKQSFDTETKKFGIGDNNAIIKYDIGKETKVISYFSNGKNKIPYIFNYKNTWCVTRYDSEGVLFYILADAMHDILNEKHQESKKVFVRIEDIHSRVDLKKLKAIGDYLNKEGIPYMIALIPAYTENKRVYKMSENREFVKLIKYLQDNGASIVLHGYTHQIRDEKTGEGYEFWDIKNNRPPSDDMDEFMYKRIKEALDECISCGIYPLAFEAPHYAIDSNGYEFLKKHFSTYVGHIQTSDYTFSTTAYPYEIKNIEFINKLVPENLGFVYDSKVEDIYRNYEKLSVIRDFTGGFYFHSFVDIDYLKKIIEFLKHNDVEFYDLKKQENTVSFENILIKSSGEEVYCNINKKTRNIRINFSDVQLIVACSFGVICLMLTFILIHSIRLRREDNVN